jgi:ribosomal protein S18 acetylase RimI-like enzyme
VPAAKVLTIDAFARIVSRVNPTLSIRTALPSDADVLADYNTRIARETESITLDPATVSRGVRAALADPQKAIYFVAEVEGRVVGQLMITHEWSDWRDGDIWWVQSVYVHPDYRKIGAFKALYRHAEQAARAAGAVGIRLYVDAHNEVAQAAYTRLGMHLSNYRVMEVMFT